jgi:hypothetical protein
MANNIKSKPDSKSDGAVERWQRQLLPAMRGSLVILTSFFLVITLLQYFQLYGDIRQQPSGVNETLAIFEKSLPESQRTSIEYLDWRVRVMLEVDAMRLRHQHINASQLMRAWTRYTGFLVGMVLALVGAFFILGKLAEPPSQVSGEMPGVKFTVASNSPGIILTVLGCCLMFVTLYLHTDFTVEDRPVYLTTITSDVAKIRILPPPEILKEQEVDSTKTEDGFPPPPK